MAWRGLHLSRPSRLSLADGQIVIAQDDGEVRLAIEDVAYVVADTPQISLTTALLAACMEAGVALIVTDATHHPSGLLLPFHRHHRQAGVAQLQAATSQPFRKRLWQIVVRAKIINQAAALATLGRPEAGTLREMARLVASGDARNVEARAARAYWSALWSEFRREDENDRRNKLLNYGYAVVRAGVARALVAAGFLPALGIWHASVSNAFNLADDFVEPFRPFVDLLAWQVAQDGASEPVLSVADRRMMAGVLMTDAHTGHDTVTLLVAAERLAESLVQAMQRKAPGVVVLPGMLP